MEQILQVLGLVVLVVLVVEEAEMVVLQAQPVHLGKVTLEVLAPPPVGVVLVEVVVLVQQGVME